MANWILEQLTMACGHVEETKIPHPEFDGEQINPAKWRKAVASTPCQACFKREEASKS